MTCPFVPEGWEETDGTFIIKDEAFYILGSPLPEDTGFSFSMVCSEEKTAARYPWLLPCDRSEDYSDSWLGSSEEAAAAADGEGALAGRLSRLLEETMPAFHAAVRGEETTRSARINRRASWLKMMEGDSYADVSGRVALIGDSAHAMTASIGEGCNCALESAAELVARVEALMRERGEGFGKCSHQTLRDGFSDYGRSRPKEVQPVQLRSAIVNGWKETS